MNFPNEKAVSQPGVSLWVNGGAVPSGSPRSGVVTNPASGNVIRRVPFANAEDIDFAVKAAGAALPAWRSSPPLRRARVMQKFLALMQAHQHELARLASEEHGKTLRCARKRAARHRGDRVRLRHPASVEGRYTENMARASTATRAPGGGECAGITPFNFPAMVPLWMFPLAIACGNTFILKPSESPSTSMKMAELFRRPGCRRRVQRGPWRQRGGGCDPQSSAFTPCPSSARRRSRLINETCARNGSGASPGGARTTRWCCPTRIWNSPPTLIGAATVRRASAAWRSRRWAPAVIPGALLHDKEPGKSRSAPATARRGNGPFRHLRMRGVTGYVDTGVAEGAQLVLDGRQKSPDRNGFSAAPHSTRSSPK
jgi:malonate-semialdehyde dehydrogenase (acetylating)/methylmalonate-semialdehyde dehydrogenase